MANRRSIPSSALHSRRELLSLAGTGVLASGVITQTPERRRRIACIVAYWAGPGSHVGWIFTKLLDG